MLIKKENQFLRFLQRIQPKPKVYFQERPDTIHRIQVGQGRLYWILSRGLCRFAYYDLSSVPMPMRASVMRLKLRQPDLYEDMGTMIAWSENGAMVWRWDRSIVNEAIQTHQLKAKESNILPETLFQPPQQNGQQFLKLKQGYEAQHWQDGVLKNSRWWKDKPSLAEWYAFLRDCGCSIKNVTQLPSAIDVELQKQPWRLARQSSDKRQKETAIYAILVFVMALPCLWFGVAAIKNWQELQKTTAEISRIKKTAQPVIDLREQALLDLERITQLAETDPWPDQLTLMANVSDVLGKNSAWLSGWSFGQGKVKITIESPLAISSSALVGALQETGFFKNASVVAGGGGHKAIIEMEVIKL